MENSINQNTNRVADAPTSPFTQRIPVYQETMSPFHEMKNNLTPPIDVEAMRAGFNSQRNAFVDGLHQFSTQNMQHYMDRSGINNRNVILAFSNVGSIVEKIKQTEDQAVQEKLFGDLMNIHHGLFSSFHPSLFLAIIEMSTYICIELKENNNFLNNYHAAVLNLMQGLPMGYNVGVLHLQAGRLSVKSSAEQEKTGKVSPDTSVQTVLTNEQLTNLVIDTAKALDGLRSEVRNLAAKTRPIGGRY